MLQNTKNHWKSMKNHCLLQWFWWCHIFHIFSLLAPVLKILLCFWMDLAFKMIMEAVICVPLASLGSIWGQLSASLGQSWDSSTAIFDALPCTGSIFCDLAPPQRQIFQEIWLSNRSNQPTKQTNKQTNKPNIQPTNRNLSSPPGFQASKPPIGLGGMREA